MLKANILTIVYFMIMVDLGWSKSSTYIKGGLSAPSLSFQAKNTGTDVEPPDVLEIEYEPEVPLVGFLGFAWKGFSLSYSQQLEKGETKMTFTDYALGLEYSWIGTEISYSEFAKFKVATGRGFSDDIGDDEKKRNDLDVRLIASNTYLFPLRWGYDHSAAFEPSAKKSSGIGLGVVLSVNQLNVKTQDGFIPETWKQAFGNDGEFYRGSILGYGAQLTAAGILALGDFFLTGLVAVGPGKQEFEYSTVNEKRKGDGVTTNMRLKLGLGWNGKRYFFVFSGVRESPSYLLKHMTLTATRQESQIMFGYKF